MLDALLGPGHVECLLHIVDELHMLVEFSYPDWGGQCVPQQQPVGTGDGRVQVVLPALWRANGMPLRVLQT